MEHPLLHGGSNVGEQGGRQTFTENEHDVAEVGRVMRRDQIHFYGITI